MNSEYTRRLEKIEAVLHQVLPPQVDQTWIKNIAGPIPVTLNPASMDKINAPNRELLGRGGKRWRPLVLVLAYEAQGGSGDLAYQLTPLVELPHNGSLIIDDIEDKSDERRGGPAIHLMYGVDMAINSGNFLYFQSTDILERTALDSPTLVRLYQLYLRVMRRLHFGQGLDIQWHNDHQFIPSVDEYLQMCRFKTGSLARLAAQIGSAAAGAPDPLVEAMGQIWEDIGVGFQILDDVINLVHGNPGKLRGDDIIEGKKSLPVILHCAQASDRGKKLLNLFTQVSQTEKTAAGPLILQAIAEMETTGVFAQAQAQALALLDASRQKLKTLGQPSAARGLQDGLVQTFLDGLKL